MFLHVGLTYSKPFVSHQIVYFISDAYTSDHIRYAWKTDNIKIISDEMSQYSVIKSTTHERSANFSDIGMWNIYAGIFYIHIDIFLNLLNLDLKF